MYCETLVVLKLFRRRNPDKRFFEIADLTNFFQTSFFYEMSCYHKQYYKNYFIL